MTATNYPKCLAQTLYWEGGYSNHPKDPGGATMKGVTQAVYDAYRERRNLAQRSVQKITQDELEAIYRKQYWDVVRGDDLPGGLDLAVFDFAVNSGTSRAVKFLQQLLGVRVDGQLGEATLHAIRDVDSVEDLATSLCDKRLTFLKSLSTWSTFGSGWSNRVKGIRKVVMTMADDGHAPLPILPAAQNAAAKGRAEDQAVTRTTTGKGGATAAVGVMGSTATEAAEKLSYAGDAVEIIKYISALLLLVGVGLTLYGIYRTSKSPEVLE